MSAGMDDDRGRCLSAFRHDHQCAVTRGKLSGKNPLCLGRLLGTIDMHK
jgi:hypothetical protein